MAFLLFSGSDDSAWTAEEFERALSPLLLRLQNLDRRALWQAHNDHETERVEAGIAHAREQLVKRISSAGRLGDLDVTNLEGWLFRVARNYCNKSFKQEQARRVKGIGEVQLDESTFVAGADRPGVKRPVGWDTQAAPDRELPLAPLQEDLLKRLGIADSDFPSRFRYREHIALTLGAVLEGEQWPVLDWSGVDRRTLEVRLEAVAVGAAALSGVRVLLGNRRTPAIACQLPHITVSALKLLAGPAPSPKAVGEAVAAAIPGQGAAKDQHVRRVKCALLGTVANAA